MEKLKKIFTKLVEIQRKKEEFIETLGTKIQNIEDYKESHIGFLIVDAIVNIAFCTILGVGLLISLGFLLFSGTYIAFLPVM